MLKKPGYPVGDIVVFREIWDGKIWNARPAIVVQDDEELIALHVPVNAVWKHCCSTNGDKVTTADRKSKSWILYDSSWPKGASYIRLAVPGEPYSVLCFRNEIDDTFRYWYINLEDPDEPMHRADIGFDTSDHILDMIIKPDLHEWFWDDEDELEEAIEAGLISQAKARLLYETGEQARDLLQSGNSVFSGWDSWYPDPSWPVPRLPDGWDLLT